VKKSLLANQGRRQNERGATLVLVTFFMVALFAFAALSLDVGNVLREQRKAQIGTDAAALAAAAKLGNNPSVVITEALVVAATNGVTTAEIAYGAHGGYPGQIQLGNWDPTRGATNRFLAGGSPTNAVRVPARRTVDLFFAKVVGLSQMTPAVHSVATMTPGGMVPFGIGSALVAGVATNCTDPKDTSCVITLSKQNNGNWGKLNLGDVLNNPNAWEDAFVNGYPGTLGQDATLDGEPVILVDTDPGFAKLKDAWDLRMASNPIVVLPVVIQFFNGRSTVTIIEYATVKLLNQRGTGNGWKGDVQLLSISDDPVSLQANNVRQLVE